MFRRLKVYAGPDHPHESQVADSLKAAEKDREEGVAWIGLPKPLYNKRERKVRKVEELASPVEETVAEAQVIEEPVSEEPIAEASSETVDTEPAEEVQEAAEEPESAEPPTAAVTDAGSPDEAEDSSVEDEVPATEPVEEEKERGA